jgi:hypothetical protein
MADATVRNARIRSEGTQHLIRAAQVTSVSGRGVGMDAIGAMIAERGGQAGVPFTGDLICSHNHGRAVVIYCLICSSDVPTSSVI